MMTQRELNDLDNYITGHYGEDQFKRDPDDDDDDDDDNDNDD